MEGEGNNGSVINLEIETHLPGHLMNEKMFCVSFKECLMIVSPENLLFVSDPWISWFPYLYQISESF